MGTSALYVGPLRILGDNDGLSESVYVGVVLAFFAVSVLGMALLGAPEEVTATFNTSEATVDIRGEPTAVHEERFQTVCLGSGCIPPVTYPAYTAVEDATWLEPGDQVVSVSVEGRRYAFPLHVLRFHAVVNTRLGGRQLAVTYSPYSGVPKVFSRKRGDRLLTFEHSGKLYNGNMLMRDRETGTLWSQFQGTAVQGELAGERLRERDAHIARWGIWKRNNPDGRVLARPSGVYPVERYRDDPYRTYRRSGGVVTRDGDDRLHPMEVVYGAVAGGEAAAYREVTVMNLDLVQDTLGGIPMMLVQDERSDRIRGFRRVANGTELEFRVENDGLVDTRTGTHWDMDGRAVRGPMAGKRLKPVGVTRSYWFTWSLFHPQTELYEERG